MSIFPFAAAFLIVGAAPTADLQPSVLPEGVRAMIDAAIDGGDARTIESVLRIARETHGSAAAEIDAIEQGWRIRTAAAKEQMRKREEVDLAEAGMLGNWKGQAEVGASRSTGRSSYFGLFGSLALDREGLDWRHKLLARAEIQKGRNITDTERLIASWQPNFKVDDRLYTYGLAQYERDPVQGYDGRYTAGGGIGYGLIATESAALDLEGGPAVRHIEQTGGPSYSGLAARGSINLRWALSPAVELKQTSALYFEQEGDSSASALTSLDAKVTGPLKVRFSYDVRYENRAGGGDGWIDTLSRATLVYNF